MLPARLIIKIQQIRQKVDAVLIRFFVKTKWLSSVYYVLFNLSFGREAQAVLAGRIKHDRDIEAGSQFKLRRNIHRLEKGLIMKPRRAIFAEGYIGETVDSYVACLAETNYCHQEQKWAKDVLLEYFSVVEASPVINKASQEFFNADTLTAEGTRSSVPYFADQRPSVDVTPDELYQLFRKRRSVRWFSEQPVEMLSIEKAIEMAAQAPSACNRQPFKFHVINNPTKAQQIASIPMGTKGFSQNIQSLLVLVGDLSAYPKERDRHVIYIDGGLVAMQLMLALESLGLSSCPINWPDMEAFERKMDKALSLEPFQRPIMLMAVGYADESGQIPYSQKKTAKALIKEIH